MTPERTDIREDGRLRWDGCDLAALAREHGTPLFVVSRRRLRNAYDQVTKVFRDAGLDARIFYSFKTNPVPDVLRTLVSLGCGAEVISEFGLWLATELGLEGDRIIINGTVKSPGLLRRAVACRPALINTESAAEVAALKDLAADTDEPVNVGLRINPGLRTARWDFATSSGSARSHMGFVVDGEEFRRALAILHEAPGLRLRGLHFHLGSGIRRSAPYRAALKQALAVWADLIEQGFRPEVLDIGGGFSTGSLKPMGLRDALRAVALGRSPKPPPPMPQGNLVAEVARTFSRTLREFAAAHGGPMPTVYVEPGRALTGRTQVLLLTVQRLVERPRGETFAVCDAGALSLSPLLTAEYHDILVADETDGKGRRSYTLVGNMPASLDVVSYKRDLPVLSPGNVLAVMDVGAYFTSLGNTFAGPRPAIVAVEDGTASLVRRRETHEDLVSRDMGWTEPSNER